MFYTILQQMFTARYERINVLNGVACFAKQAFCFQSIYTLKGTMHLNITFKIKVQKNNFLMSLFGLGLLGLKLKRHYHITPGQDKVHECSLI